MKIGPHIIGSAKRMLDVIERWQPSIVLFLDPTPSDVQNVRRRCPNTILVGRIFEDDATVDREIKQNPEGYADAVVRDRIGPAAAEMPQVDFWQFNNEVAQTDINGMKALNRFSLRYMDLLEQRDRRGAVLAFSVGNPADHPGIGRMRLWQEVHPTMRRCKANGHIMLLHAYGAPTMFQPDRNWFLHRYEMVVQPHLPDDLKDTPYCYGEWGIDRMILEPDNRGGWMVYASAEDYLQQLLRSEDFLYRNAPHCKGAATFTCGVLPNNRDWILYDIWPQPAGILADAAVELRRSRRATPKPPPAPTPVPPPVPVSPPGREEGRAEHTREILHNIWWHGQEAVREIERGDTAEARARILHWISRQAEEELKHYIR